MEIDGNDIIELGVPEGPLVGKALRIVENMQSGASPENAKEIVLDHIKSVFESPEDFLGMAEAGETAVRLESAVEFGRQTEDFAEALIERREREQFLESLAPLDEPQEFAEFGSGLIPMNAREQMRDAMRIPAAVKGAMMPDAHLGYGLPVGGVWGLDNAVSPNAVGVDIGCRMALSIFPTTIQEQSRDRLAETITRNTHFGAGSGSDDVTDHKVFDHEAWEDIGWLRSIRGKARYQLGSSGGGNHFVEWCSISVNEPLSGQYGTIQPGEYLALMSHSGSRGLGFKIAQHYREIAEERCYGLSSNMKKLAWLSLDEDSGREYWKAMELAGSYAKACHDVIHKEIASSFGTGPIYHLDHHHNFAWKEEVDGQELIVHRKGATPAAKGQIGLIPGSMGEAAYLVRGKGHPASLSSCSHGAGRRFSRTEAKKQFTVEDRDASLRKNNVDLIGGGLDEHPAAYKNIGDVIASQKELCEPVAMLVPKVVRMADD